MQDSSPLRQTPGVETVSATLAFVGIAAPFLAGSIAGSIRDRAGLAVARRTPELLERLSLWLKVPAYLSSALAYPIVYVLASFWIASARPPGFVTLSENERARYVGRYAYGSASDEMLMIANEKTGLTITRPGLPFPRGLTPVGRDEFVPMGAESARIRFSFRSDGGIDLTLTDPEPILTATLQRGS